MAKWRSKHHDVANDSGRALMVRKGSKSAPRQIRPVCALGLKMKVRKIYKAEVLSHLMKRRSEQEAVTSGNLHRIRGARPWMSGVELRRLRAESCQIRVILCGILKK